MKPLLTAPVEPFHSQGFGRINDAKGRRIAWLGFARDHGTSMQYDTAAVEALTRLIVEAPAMRDMLLALEWAGLTDEGPLDYAAACCPVCVGLEPGRYELDDDEKIHEGHATDCRLRALLARLPEARQ